VVYDIDGVNRIATSIETHVAPGDGRARTIGVLEGRPSDDTGAWVVGVVSYKGDSAIEIELELDQSVAQAAPIAGALLVMVNSYQASDGTQYATAITAVHQVFLPAVER